MSLFLSYLSTKCQFFAAQKDGKLVVPAVTDERRKGESAAFFLQAVRDSVFLCRSGMAANFDDVRRTFLVTPLGGGGSPFRFCGRKVGVDEAVKRFWVMKDFEEADAKHTKDEKTSPEMRLDLMTARLFNIGSTKRVVVFPVKSEGESGAVEPPPFESQKVLEKRAAYDMLFDLKFVMVDDFFFKMFVLSQRMQTGHPMIISGETGVGKTYLLSMMSRLYNEGFAHKLEDAKCPNHWKYATKTVLTKAGNAERLFTTKPPPKDKDKVIDLLPDALPHATPRLCRLLASWNGGAPSLSAKSSLLDVLFSDLPAEVAVDVRRSVKTELTDLKISTAPLDEMLRFELLLRIENGVLVNRPNAVRALRKATTTIPLDGCVLLERGYRSVEPVATFYRLLVHPGLRFSALDSWLATPKMRAENEPDCKFIVFYDEVNTSSILGTFREIFVDRRFKEDILQRKIFFVGAMNPNVHGLYDVHKLPEAMQRLCVEFGGLTRYESGSLHEYVKRKVFLYEEENRRRGTEAVLSFLMVESSRPSSST